MPDTWVTPRIWAAGERVSASKMNEISNDLRVLFPYTTSGDIAYRDAAGAYLTRLPITKIAGLLHTKNVANFSPGGQAFSSTWADITGATLNLTLSYTCTIMVKADVAGYNAITGRRFSIRAMVNGTADASPGNIYNGGQARNESLHYEYYATGVPSGTRTVKLQCQADTDPNYVDAGRLEAFAFVE